MGADEKTEHACCERCTRLGRYVRECADLMGLRDWTVSVGHDPPEFEDDLASVETGRGRRDLLVRVRRDFDSLDWQQRQYVIAHELAHALVRDLFYALRHVEEELSGSTRRVFESQLQLEEERLVDVIARIAARSLPLPT